jgi:hypothetical protein
MPINNGMTRRWTNYLPVCRLTRGTKYPQNAHSKLCSYEDDLRRMCSTSTYLSYCDPPCSFSHLMVQMAHATRYPAIGLLPFWRSITFVEPMYWVLVVLLVLALMKMMNIMMMMYIFGSNYGWWKQPLGWWTCVASRPLVRGLVVQQFNRKRAQPNDGAWTCAAMHALNNLLATNIIAQHDFWITWPLTASTEPTSSDAEKIYKQPNSSCETESLF